MMKKIMNSLQTKLILSFVFLIVVVAGGIFILTFGQTKKALLDSTREDMLQIIGIASTHISGQQVDQILQFKEGQDANPSYLAIKKQLQDMRAVSPNVVNFYIIRINGDKASFLVDDAPDGGAKIDEEYSKPEPRLFDAVNGPSVSDDIYTDEYGTFLSGYAPIKSSDGKTTIIFGGDMDASKVLERQNFIGNTIYFMMGIAIIIAAIIIGIFSLTIIRDIKKLNEAAEKISTGNTQVKINIKRNDEIGELADSFGRMVASLKIMMASDDLPSDGPTHNDEK